MARGIQGPNLRTPRLPQQLQFEQAHVGTAALFFVGWLSLRMCPGAIKLGLGRFVLHRCLRIASESCVVNRMVGHDA